MSQVANADRLVAELNPEQRAAALHRGGPVLVLAGAGTGKTRVITVRISKLVAEGIPPERILALTFTNKAAGEMAERVAGFLGRDAAAAMTVGTFHSLGLRIVERDAKRLGFRRGLNLLDAADQASAVRQCIKALHIDPKRHDPRMFLAVISNARNAGLPPEHFLAEPGRALVGKVYKAYVDWLVAYQAMDFDDLILRANQLMREHPEVLRKWRDQYRTILVDEFQDTNLAQLELVRHLAEEHRSLCAVGDDDQSIYGWRGADVRNILEFERHFPDAEVLALTQNYRSTGHILAAANNVISNNSARRDKKLWTDGGEGEHVRVVTCKDPEAEANFVAAEIVRRRDNEGRAYTDFGVLFRTSMQAKAFEEAFRLAGVPYRLVGAFEFFERKEVKDLLSYMRLAIQPHDELSLLRVINFPQRGIGPRTIEVLHELAHTRSQPLFDVIAGARQIARLTGEQGAELEDLANVIRETQDKLHAKMPIHEVAMWLCERLNAREAWIRDPTEGPGGEGRWRNIESLLKGMRGWAERHPNGVLRDYLRVIALDQRDAAEESHGSQTAVALLTLHAAKGLEWPVCFVVGCQEGLLPHQRTLDDDDGDLSEERRLFYVGVTRARRVCFLSYAKSRRTFHGSEPARPSRFLREIPAAHRIEVDRQHGGGEPVNDKSEQLKRFEALRARVATPPKRR